MTQAGGRPSATRHWSGAPRPADMRGGLGPAALWACVCSPGPVSPWRALSTDGPGRPSVPRSWAPCRLFFVQLSDIGVSWAQRGGVTGQAWAVQVVAPRLPDSGRTLSRKQSGNSRNLWGPESPL